MPPEKNQPVPPETSSSGRVAGLSPGPCPACGAAADATGIRGGRKIAVYGNGRGFCKVKCTCGLIGPRGGYDEAIAAWNGIRARVLREAAEIAQSRIYPNAHLDAAQAVCDFEASRIAEILREAADRAERGE